MNAELLIADCPHSGVAAGLEWRFPFRFLP
jgi:hypothetical protein